MVDEGGVATIHQNRARYIKQSAKGVGKRGIGFERKLVGNAEVAKAGYVQLVARGHGYVLQLWAVVDVGHQKLKLANRGVGLLAAAKANAGAVYTGA